MHKQKLIFRVFNVGITVLCYIIYNPPVHVAMVRMLS
jgi:hypothetical protein